jgi:phosphoribosylaminoimidazole carboxylase
MSSDPVIGLLGGGQLGRMLCQAAAPLDIQVAILDADASPAKQINVHKSHVAGSFKDPAKVRELAAHCDVLTVETEHISTEALEDIATNGLQVRAEDGTVTKRKVAVCPSWKTLRLIQNKYEQKEYLGKQGIPVADQMALESGEAMMGSLRDAAAKFGLPFILKSRKDSYDGRGNLKISTEDDFEQAISEFGKQSCYAERWVPFKMELSVIVVRCEDDEGNTTRLVPYPTVETVHQDNICSLVYMPPRGASADATERAQKVALDVVDKLWGRGVFAVEMFLTEGGEVLVNEM